MQVNLDNTYWERVRGFVSENQIDARWKLRKKDDGKTYGSLRIVSHPDLKPGELRSHLTLVSDIKPKTETEKLRTVIDYEIEDTELEVYSIEDTYKTETQTYVAGFKELEELYKVKIFE